MSKPDHRSEPPPPASEEGTPPPKSFLHGLGIAERAKGAMGAAADGASAIRGRASSAMSSLSEQASKRAEELVGAGLDQVSSAAADLDAALPIIKRAGFSLHAVTLSASLTPNVVATFHADTTISDEQARAIEEENSENALAVMIIRTLRRASTLQQKISIGTLKPTELSISIGLSPSVSLKFA